VFATEVCFIGPRGETGFSILDSMGGGVPAADALLPDLAPCGDCVRDLFDPANRRHRYAFTHCARCGPRYSLIESLPWDRERTTMKRFPLCPACESEYRDPADRRFHAQTLACPDCGPRMVYWEEEGSRLAEADEALGLAIEALRGGKIVAVKATGGFQLLVDARCENAVRRLRMRKKREAKALAVMVRDLSSARKWCRIDEDEARLLASSAAPIVLLEALGGEQTIAGSVAPGNPRLGVMLPSTPMHHLLLAGLGFPVVATSGNRSGEPLCIGNEEALERLGGIADAFLGHDRPIVRPVDDSVVHLVAGGSQVLRRARGFAPLPIRLPVRLPVPIFAAGAHLKNAVALGTGDRVFLSQHIGDLDTVEARALHWRTGRDLAAQLCVVPGDGVRDAHPDYWHGGFEIGADAVRVQHHVAHVAACLAEHGLTPPALGIAWDGTGWGTDGTIWGGEFFRMEECSVERVAHIRPFPLPGGETAVGEPRRSALGCGHAIFGDSLFDQPGHHPFLRPFEAGELRLLRRALECRINAPDTSSVGRLYDVVASLLGLRQVISFEGQAAMDVEFAAGDREGTASLLGISGSEPAVLDWEPIIRGILDDMAAGVEPGQSAAWFQESLVEAAVAVALREGMETVVLSGGCFQNRWLTERAVRRLREEGFRPYWHRQVPPNDGGIALGQIAAVGWGWGLDDWPEVGHDRKELTGS
jgi:hydrogenase maturation protein HypF